MQLFFFTDLTVIHETNGKDEREIFFDEDGIIIITMQKEKKKKYACNLLEIRLSKNGGRFSCSTPFSAILRGMLIVIAAAGLIKLRRAFPRAIRCLASTIQPASLISRQKKLVLSIETSGLRSWYSRAFPVRWTSAEFSAVGSPINPTFASTWRISMEIFDANSRSLCTRRENRGKESIMFSRRTSPINFSLLPKNDCRRSGVESRAN